MHPPRRVGQASALRGQLEQRRLAMTPRWRDGHQVLLFALLLDLDGSLAFDSRRATNESRSRRGRRFDQARALRRAEGERRRRSMRLKGINYDVGTRFGDQLSRVSWRRADVQHDLRVIRDQLHCNAVQLFGSDITRLGEAGAIARELGLGVWLQPRLIDAHHNAVLEHVAQAAGAAEGLLRERGDIVLNVGCELTVFSAGIVPGRRYVERAARLARPYWWPALPWRARAGDPEASPEELLPELSGAAQALRARAGGGRPGGLRQRRLDAQGRPPGRAARRCRDRQGRRVAALSRPG
jgi:hypothetical protein